MLNAMIIGSKIAEARKKKDLSQTQLAELLAVSPQAVSKWERGESMPDIITFNRMAEALLVDLNYFSESFESVVPTEPTQTENSKGWDMSSSNWKSGDFSGLSNLKNRFNSSNIVDCLFVKSDLSGIALKGNNLVGCDFTDSNLSESRIKAMNVLRNKFNGCNLKNAAFSSSQITECDFSGADLFGVSLRNCAFVKNDIKETILSNVSFEQTQLSGAIFGSVISNCSFVNCKYKDVEFSGAILKNTFFKNGNIKKIKLTDCKTDRLTYSFLKSGGAELSGIEIVGD